MESIGLTFLAIIMIALGISLGRYILSQIKCNIKKNIFNNNLKSYEDGQKKCKK